MILFESMQDIKKERSSITLSKEISDLNKLILRKEKLLIKEQLEFKK